MFYFIFEEEEQKKLLDPQKEKEAIILFPIEIHSKNDIKKVQKELTQRTENYKTRKKAVQVKAFSLFNGLSSFVNALQRDFEIVIAYGGSNKMNRFFLEQCTVDYLQDPHNTSSISKVDFIHHFNSGLNQVLCSFAKEKKTGILVETTHFSKKTWFKSKEFGRISQNITLAKKYKLPFLLTPFIKSKEELRTEEELRRIGESLGMSSEQSNSMYKELEKKIKKKENKELIEGIRLE
jgi:RNase P/RNase MRP subunit p30